MPIDVYSIEKFVPLLVPLAPRGQDCDAVSRRVERDGFLPNAHVERDRQVLYDDENPLWHDGLQALVKSG